MAIGEERDGNDDILLKRRQENGGAKFWIEVAIRQLWGKIWIGILGSKTNRLYLVLRRGIGECGSAGKWKI